MDNGSSRLQQLHKKKTKSVLDKIGSNIFLDPKKSIFFWHGPLGGV